jgi:hypothetical protein
MITKKYCKKYNPFVAFIEICYNYSVDLDQLRVNLS